MSRQLMQEAAVRSREGASHSSASYATSAAMKSYSDSDSEESQLPRGSNALKRKHTASSSASSQTTEIQFPLLADDEPSIQSICKYLPQSLSFLCTISDFVHQQSNANNKPFFCVSKHLFSLTDESRDRGSAKIASISVQLKHPSFHTSGSSRSAGSHSRQYLSCFKVDGRKSFSNAPFKRYYTRGVHAVWFADLSHTVLSAASSSPTNGRVLMFLSQRGGRPNGKGFTGLRHDPAELSPKHPLICLASNSVEYYVSVFINRSSEVFPGEDDSSSSVNWQEVEVDVSAQFEAGEVSLVQQMTNTAAVHKHVGLSAASSSRPTVVNAPRQFVHISRRPHSVAVHSSSSPAKQPVASRQIPSSISLSSMSSMDTAVFKHSPASSASSSSPLSCTTSSDETSSPMEEDDEDATSEEDENTRSGAATPVAPMEDHPDILMRQQSLVPTTTPNLLDNGLNENGEGWQFPHEEAHQQPALLASPVIVPAIKVNEDIMEAFALLDAAPHESPVLKHEESTKTTSTTEEFEPTTPSAKRQKLSIQHATLNGVSLIAHHHTFASTASPVMFPAALPDWNASSPAPLMSFSSASPLTNEYHQYPQQFPAFY